MGIIYLISILALCTGFILIKKTEKTLNLVSFILITVVVLMGYNAFVCYVFSFFNIPVTLISLSITNVVLAGVNFGIIIKKKEKQSYTVDKFGLICLGVILVAVLFVSYLDFGFPFNIKYETGDPAEHYFSSVAFSEEDRLLNLYNDGVHSFLVRKFGSYVNSGLIMKCCSSFMDSTSYYNIFIGFGIFILFLTGAMMYQTLEKFTKTKLAKFIALIVSLIYIMGYPLNSLLFGFEYLSLGILIIGTIIHIIYYYEKEELKFSFYVIIFAILNFELFCSYYMFVPFVYSALWIYFCIYSKKHYNKILCKKNVVMLVVTLLIPFWLGYIYCLEPSIYNIFNMEAYNQLKSVTNSAKIAGGLNTYGYIYINYYSNMLLFIPLTIYYIYRKSKEKKLLSFDLILLACLILFVSVLMIGKIFDKVSEYYIMKNYFILWLIMIYINFRGIMYLYKNKKNIANIGLCFYIGLIIINLIFINAPLGKGPGNPNENLLNFMEIFGVNKTIIKEGEIDLTEEQIELLRYVRDNIDLENNSVEFTIDSEQMFWEYSLIKYINNDGYSNILGQDRLQLKTMTSWQKIGKVNYMVYFKDSYYYKKTEDILFENGEVIYENEAGGIIKYNS